MHKLLRWFFAIVVHNKPHHGDSCQDCACGRKPAASTVYTCHHCITEECSLKKLADSRCLSCRFPAKDQIEREPIRPVLFSSCCQFCIELELFGVDIPCKCRHSETDSNKSVLYPVVLSQVRSDHLLLLTITIGALSLLEESKLSSITQ